MEFENTLQIVKNEPEYADGRELQIETVLVDEYRVLAIRDQNGRLLPFTCYPFWGAERKVNALIHDGFLAAEWKRKRGQYLVRILD